MPVVTTDIRSAFSEFFKSKDHKILPSGPIVPLADPTLMFANAGMVQFKNVFTDLQPRPAARVASVQKCIRISGKHNDLENVGRTSRHHTFFEMLGNFSFGDYFKKEACAFGWEFLTEVLKLDKDKLWVSVFEGDDNAPADQDAKHIWCNELGVPENRILKGSAKDNFWSMGNTGPCGPCSEIMYDRGEAFGEASLENGERFFELWNLVFMQYHIAEVGGPLLNLPKPCIDTGAGLERIASVLQGKDSNYDIDIFKPLIALGAKLAGKKYGADTQDDISIRVIADHARMTAHLIAEGIFPEKTGREYVLRRVMRRAVRHGHRLGIQNLFFHKVVDKVVDVMGNTYPELVEHRDMITKVSEQEEDRFRTTLSRGLDLLRENTSWVLGPDGKKMLPGTLAFDLSATYGFPLDLIKVIGEEDGFLLDSKGYTEAEARHKAVSGAGKIGEEAVSTVYNELLSTLGSTEFGGYDNVTQKTEILAIIVDGKTVPDGHAEQKVEIILKKTPFYGESGGQIGDRGIIETATGQIIVHDTQRPLSKLWVHSGVITKGHITRGDKAEASVDTAHRLAIARHHTATHLLHAVLRKHLGSHATQKGSRVANDMLRFDFSNFEPVSSKQLYAIERDVLSAVLANLPVTVTETSYDQARADGAMAIFEENYGDTVRLVKIGEVSSELCGGIHVANTGEIGPFFITAETGIAAGVRRIEAVTGTAALDWFVERRNILEQASAMLKGRPTTLVEKIDKLLAREKALVKEADKLKRDLAGGGSEDIMDKVKVVAGIKVLGVTLSVGDPATMREAVDTIRQKIGSGVVCLGGENKGKASIIVAVTKDLTNKIKANELIKEVSVFVGGRGGGRPDMAQAGGPDSSKLDQATEAIYDVVAQSFGIATDKKDKEPHG